MSYQDFLDELEQFLNGRHDDQGGTVSIAFGIAGKKPGVILFAADSDTPRQNFARGLHGNGGSNEEL